MKILVVSHSCVTPINQQLYAELGRITDWQIDLVVPSGWRDEYGNIKSTARLPAFTGNLIPIPVWRSGDIILHLYKASFRRLVRKLAPDVVYVNHEPYALATAQVVWGAARAGAGCIGFYSCQNIQKRYPPPFRWLEAMVLRRCKFSFPISTVVDEVFRAKGFRGLSRIMPLAVDTHSYYPRPEATRIRASISELDVPLIGFVGRLVPEKGLVTLLDAMTKLLDLPWHLVLVGSGPQSAELRAKAKATGLAGRITFTGFIPHHEVPAYLSALDVLVLPSETQRNWKEQFGRVLLEAMACGTVVLGSNSGEIPALITATSGGLIFSERDSEHLASQMKLLIQDSDLRKSLASAGADAIKQRYAVTVVARSFAETIRAALNLADCSTEPALTTQLIS